MFGVKGGNFIYKIFKLWARAWYLTVGIIHKEIYEQQLDKNKQFIFIANHISYIDIPPVIIAIHQPVRALGKAEMTKIPIFGTIYRASVIMVNRSSAEHRAKSVRALKAALTKGISVFLFPEGTFNETEKPLKEFFDGAFRIAIETQTDIKPIILLDALDRLHYKSIFSLTPGKSRVVFLKEISVKGMQLKDVQQLKNIAYKQMEDALLAYKKENA